MSRFILSVLLCFSCFLLPAQELVLKIDSLPEEGILLKDQWKFRAGDEPEWAEAAYDDRSWVPGFPLKNIHTFDVPGDAPVGWFRLRLRLDSSLLKRPLVFQVHQNMASEIYLNGVLLKKYGVVSGEKDLIRGDRPYYNAFGVQFDSVDQVLAVRFALEKNLPYLNITPGNVGLYLRITDVGSALKNVEYQVRSVKWHYFEAGIFLVLFLIHIRFFLIYSEQKANLFFSIAMFGAFFGSIVATHGIFGSVPLRVKMYCMLIYSVFGTTIYNTATFVAIYHLLKARRNFYFWFLTIFSASGTFFVLLFTEWGFPVTKLSLFLNTLTLVVLAFRSRKKEGSGYGIILWGLVSYFLFFLGYVLIVSVVLKTPNAGNLSVLRDILFHASILGLPICISIYLSREYPVTSMRLVSRMMEVQKLSEEKQEMLVHENSKLQAAVLQGQTTERKRVAADLHDTLGTTMSALKWTMESLNTEGLLPEEQKVYLHLKDMLEGAYDEVRLLSHNLLPKEFEKQGLAEALRGLIHKLNQNTKVKFSLGISGDFSELDNRTAFELYSISLELVNNIIKHSGATTAEISLKRQEGELRLRVNDNGSGFEARRGGGIGLKNVEMRAESIPARLIFSSPDKRGLCVEVIVAW